MSPLGAWAAARAAADYVQDRSRFRPSVGIVLGSGLGQLADQVAGDVSISYVDIPGFVPSTVEGHAGRLVLGRVAGTEVCVLQGRLHYYEGYSPTEITHPVRMLQLMGVQTLILTNAAGGLHPEWQAGDLMAITDHINLVGMGGVSPLRGPNDERLGPRFPELSDAYDAQLLDLARAEARAQALALREGVYAAVSGPNYETPAEVRYLRSIGADAVGMSTVPEVIVARHASMRVLAVSLISNIALDSRRAVSENLHEHVLQAGHDWAPRMASLLEGVLRHI